MTFAELTEPKPGGTWKLIWLLLVNRMVAIWPATVTVTTFPEKPEPCSVATEPDTNGLARKVAALTILLIVTVGAGGGVEGGGACTVNVTGTVLLPAWAPASITILALYVPGARFWFATNTRTLPGPTRLDGCSNRSHPEPLT